MQIGGSKPLRLSRSYGREKNVGIRVANISDLVITGL